MTDDAPATPAEAWQAGFDAASYWVRSAWWRVPRPVNPYLPTPTPKDDPS